MTTDNKTLAVDVLAVMDREAKLARHYRIENGAVKVAEEASADACAAREAVAELMEAGAAYAEIVASSDNWTGDEHMYFAQMAGAELDSSRWVVIQMAQSRFESALARVKGESA